MNRPTPGRAAWAEFARVPPDEGPRGPEAEPGWEPDDDAGDDDEPEQTDPDGPELMEGEP